MDRKKMIMIGLAAVFAVSVIYRITHPYKQGTVDQLTYTGNPKVRVKRKISTSGATQTSGQFGVRVDLLSQPPRQSHKVVSNIFHSRRSMPKASAMAKRTEQPATTSNAAIAVVEDPQAQIKRQLGDFKSFGFHSNRDGKSIFLKRGKHVFVVRKGDRIDGRYRIEAVTEKTMTLRSNSIDEPIILQLSEL